MTGREGRIRLLDILERIDAIRVAEARLGRAADQKDEELLGVCLDAIQYSLVIIGEAVRGLDAQIVERNSDIPWRDITGMRNLLTHEYFRVSEDIVRAVLDEPLSLLQGACRAELARSA